MQVMIINRKTSNEKTEKHETMQVLIGIWPVVRPYFLIACERFLAVLNVGDHTNADVSVIHDDLCNKIARDTDCSSELESGDQQNAGTQVAPAPSKRGEVQEARRHLEDNSEILAERSRATIRPSRGLLQACREDDQRA